MARGPRAVLAIGIGRRYYGASERPEMQLPQCHSLPALLIPIDLQVRALHLALFCANVHQVRGKNSCPHLEVVEGPIRRAPRLGLHHKCHHKLGALGTKGRRAWRGARGTASLQLHGLAHLVDAVELCRVPGLAQAPLGGDGIRVHGHGAAEGQELEPAQRQVLQAAAVEQIQTRALQLTLQSADIHRVRGQSASLHPEVVEAPIRRALRLGLQGQAQRLGGAGADARRSWG